MVTVTYLGNKKTLEIEGKVVDILKSLSINPETVVVGLNGTIVPENKEVKKGDRVDIVRIVSGG